MNVLIINLTRFGDLIQTQPVISGLVEQGHRVGLVCLENFASAATLLDGVDEVFPFPGAGLLSLLDSDWRLAVERVSAFRDRVFERMEPGRIVNLTPSVSSRLLARALAPDSGDVAGFSVDEFGFNADSSAWAAFLQLAGSNRGASPFNLCDIFRRTAGLGDEGNSLVLALTDDAVLSEGQQRLTDGTSDSSNGYLALQMGASEERRRWPVEYFVRLAELVWERDGLVPVLLGTKGEAHLGERFRERAGCPSVDLMGGTSLTELAGVLGNCAALVTNDTGTMHLAAGLGVPLCAVFLATAQPWDTGPYRAGNLCLEPDMDCHPCRFGTRCPNDNSCRRAVGPETLYASLRALLDGGDPEGCSGARVWRTRTGDYGFMDLISLSGHDDADRTVWKGQQRTYFRAFLDGDIVAEPCGLGRKLSTGMAEELSKTLTNARDMLFLLSRQGMLLASNPRSQAKAKFLASWQRLQGVFDASEYLDILGKLWMFESQKSGGDLASLLSLVDRYHGLVSSLVREFE
ncbi:glycosyltransferase family 9 protein [Pseudodesulfovibrio cashew]|uniref:Glycosyltransferase family 9 protein n=1 Tax=Pseudodesulfovibrio cashew TaxID=2678688 RepID=A0A6I6JKM4_9BACT|nr:glycosyltransferase family 9 protein [Pseudodesulfovibrio cashew]QGY40863.1 glycosyltransferase family 9 protein [Pseudodesulfovibrio cashew]